jgi:hypothetical protein
MGTFKDIFYYLWDNLKIEIHQKTWNLAIPLKGVKKMKKGEKYGIFSIYYLVSPR